MTGMINFIADNPFGLLLVAFIMVVFGVHEYIYIREDNKKKEESI